MRLIAATGAGRQSGAGRRPLPESWKPEPLPDDLAAAIRVLPGVWYQRQLDTMRDHVRRKGKAGWRADWQAFWVAWVARALDATGRAKPVEAAPCTAGELLPVGLPGSLDQFAAMVLSLIGAANYRAWLKDCSFRIEGEHVQVVARSGFVRSYVEENFGPAARSAAKRVGFDGVTFELLSGGCGMPPAPATAPFEAVL